MKHLLITGAKGQLGQSFTAIAKHWPQLQFTFVDSKQADITDGEKMAALLGKFKPDVVINCAAFTQVDLAEQQPELAYAVNAIAVKQLAQLCRDANILLVHISTDYVFSGKPVSHLLGQQAYTEHDLTEPINVYGVSKLAGEQAMLNIGTPGFILRTSWLYSEFGHNFVRSIWQKIQQGVNLQVVADQVGSPTYAPELAVVCLKLLTTADFEYDFAKPQILHCASQGQTSWYQLAQAIQQYSNTKHKVTITAINSKQWPATATRPAYSALNSQKLQQQFSLSMPSWQQSLVTCLNKMGQSD
jgi:dTDP-4-dehydrorhamnose reductase